ncbi:MAG: EAL domain-containing protein [Pseudanabaenaceae cyanobacterium SKYGB_i_bin29]|nr:EAL domain-containing protein [Pseudanabaenaceae cyanobacterium SKYG29]MDW8421214.1 EAL domain-containing protein [Pseudanabaenaceae cyanobacterium SKYGB_i_bin29]
MSTFEGVVLPEMIESAIINGEMSLVFQVQSCLSTNSLFGVEALTRWRAPNVGRIDTSKMIRALESSSLSLVRQFHEWLLQEAFGYISLWQEIGIRVPIYINFSSRYLQCKESLHYILYLVQEYKIDPHYLGIELTETAPITDREEIFFVLHHLHLLGVKIVLDDFCTSYCSLEYLCDFPVDVIKLDKTFTKGLVDPSPDRRAAITTILHHVTTMAHNLGIAVLAEGVETIEELAAVTELGCDAYQGYLLSPPVPAPLARIMLTDQARSGLNRFPLRTA